MDALQVTQRPQLAAYLSYARTLRRLSHDYAAWAREDEAAGRDRRAAQYRREVERTRTEAWCAVYTAKSLRSPL